MPIRLSTFVGILYLLLLQVIIFASSCDAYEVLQFDSELFSVGGKLVVAPNACDKVFVCGLDSSGTPALLQRQLQSCKNKFAFLNRLFSCYKIQVARIL